MARLGQRVKTKAERGRDTLEGGEAVESCRLNRSHAIVGRRIAPSPLRVS